jgi:hypothetical protein
MKNPLTVTLFGNVNNEMYRFAVALKEQGVQVKLITLDEGILHDPFSINSQKLDLRSDIIRTRFNDLEVTSLSMSLKKIVIRETSKSNFAMFTGSTIAFASFSKCPFSLFLSGSDAILMTRYQLPIIRIFASSRKVRGFIRYFFPMLFFVFLQRQSLRKAKFWLSLPETAFSELSNLKLKLKCEEIPQNYLPVVLDHKFKANQNVYDESIRVLLVARFNKLDQNTSISLDDKGSLIALTGLLEFARTNPNLIEFSFFAKGDISSECQAVIDELVNFCKVVQKNEATFDEFLKVMSLSEVVIDSVGASPVARNSIEALSLGKFVIANFSSFNPLDFIPDNDALKCLTFSADSSADVFDGLERYKVERCDFLNMAPDFAAQIKLAFSPKNQGAKLKHSIQDHIARDLLRKK